MSGEALIRLDHVSFAYEGGGPVLKDLSLAIERGSFTALLGRNGCGKSTAARLMNGILLPTEGRVLVDGIDTAEEDTLLEVRRRAGMVFQNPDNQLVANVVEEDVAFAPENLGVPEEELRRRVDQALRLVGMEDYALHAPHLLSGGQKQRVAIAGVLAMEPDCILLDEPTAMLDPEGRREVLDTLHRMNRELGLTVVLITHHMEEAAEADRVLILEDGKILRDGTPEELLCDSGLLRSAGLTVPETVRLLEELNRGGESLPLTALSEEACAQAIYHLFTEESSD